MITRKRIVAAGTFFTLAISACAARRTFADRIDTPRWPEFSQNVKSYTDLVDGIEKNLPALPAHTEAPQIAAHKKALADAIREARSGARPGDIFTPTVRDRFLKIVRSDVRGPAGKPARTAIQEDNPKKPGVPSPVPLKVNATYPDTAPLSTVPPSVLLRLPDLPKTVDYRFVGKALVLRDVRADLIIDFIPDALP